MVQEYGRYFGMQDLLPARRLPDRAEPQRRRAARLSRATSSSATSRAGPTRSSATRASRCATTSTRYDVARFIDAFWREPALRRGVQHRRRPGQLVSRSSRRSTGSPPLSGKQDELRVRRQEPRGRPHLLHQRSAQDDERTTRAGTSPRSSTTFSRRSTRRGCNAFEQGPASTALSGFGLSRSSDLGLVHCFSFGCCGTIPPTFYGSSTTRTTPCRPQRPASWGQLPTDRVPGPPIHSEPAEPVLAGNAFVYVALAGKRRGTGVGRFY